MDHHHHSKLGIGGPCKLLTHVRCDRSEMAWNSSALGGWPPFVRQHMQMLQLRWFVSHNNDDIELDFSCWNLDVRPRDLDESMPLARHNEHTAGCAQFQQRSLPFQAIPDLRLEVCEY